MLLSNYKSKKSSSCHGDRMAHKLKILTIWPTEQGCRPWSSPTTQQMSKLKLWPSPGSKRQNRVIEWKIKVAIFKHSKGQKQSTTNKRNFFLKWQRIMCYTRDKDKEIMSLGALCIHLYGSDIVLIRNHIMVDRWAGFGKWADYFSLRFFMLIKP